MTPRPAAERAEASAPADRDEAVDLFAVREPAGHGFHFKARASGRVYRLDAVRDPHLPRFWCFRISRCAASGVVDQAERPWFGGDRMAREDLPDAVEAIRAAPSAWLALPQNGELRRWVLEAAPIAVAPQRLSSPALRRLLGE